MSAVMADKQQNDGIQLAVPGLGERLRSARMARDLDTRKLADRIHLTVDTVEALERDDYSDMPARVFVRGYVKNYARTVNLPVDSILAQFDGLWPEEDASVRVNPSPRLAADSKPVSRWHGAMTWLILVVLLVLFLSWWQGYLDRYIDQWGKQQMQRETSESVVEAPAGPSQDNARPSQPAAVATGSGEMKLPPIGQPINSSQTEAAKIAESGASSSDVPNPPVSEPAEQPMPAMGVSPPATDKSAPALTTTPAAAMKTLPRKPVVAEPKAVSAEPPAAVATVAGAPEIVVRFSRDCWVDIRDSTRTFKLVGTMKKGTERKLEGKPPYKVVLGNAEAAEILVAGKPFDLAAHTVANVARFTLAP